MKDYLLLLDENEKLKRIVNAYEFYDDEIKSTTAGERVLTFKMNDSVVDIENGNKIGVFIEGKFDLFIVDQVEAETYYSTSIKVTCLHDFYSIQTQKAITQYYKESVSVHDAMTEMLKGTSYELGECVERSLIPIGPYLYKNPLWCIQDIISNFGVEIDYSIELNETRTGIAKKLVHVVNALGSDTGIRCSTDLNVSKIKRVQKDKFYTVMYGCGSEYQKDLVKYKYDFKDISWSTSNGNPTDKPAGQEFVEDKKAIAKYGRIIGIFEDGRIKDPELLLKKTWETLQKNNRPIVSYELDIEELKTEDGYEHLNFKLGDIIILQNTIDNSRAKFRIVEDCKSIRNKNKRKVVVGEQLKGIFSGGNSGNSDGTEGPGGSVIDPGGEEIQPPSLEEITPDTLPAVPVVTAKGLWAKVMLSWTYESKMYYNYEVYASKIKDFEPTVFHMIYSGKASAFLHEVGAKETWYYRVRAVNTFGNATELSEQSEATTTKVTDGTEYFESAAIKDALIEELRLDRGWIGQLDATYLNIKGKFTILDGNDVRTMYVDSFGRVELKPSVFTLTSECVTNVSTKDEVDKKVSDAKKELNSNIDNVQSSVNDLKEYTDGAFKDGLLTEDEKSKIESLKKPLETELATIIKEYAALYQNSDLVGTSKTNLKNAYDSYKLKYDGLISTINALLKLTEITDQNKLALDNAYAEHDTMLATYKEKVSAALDSIAAKKAETSLNDAKVYTNAQFKIVDDKISQKVSKTEYDSNNNVVNEKISKLTQDSEKFEYSFTDTGAENEVLNSTFLGGMNNWYEFNWQGPKGNLHAASGDGYVPTGMTAMRIGMDPVIGATSGLGYGVHQNLKLKPNTDYMISYFTFSHRVKDLIFEVKYVKSNGETVHVVSEYCTTGGGDGTVWGINPRQYRSFRTPDIKDVDTYQIFFWIGASTDTNPVAWISQVMISEGKLKNKWRANSNEVMSNNFVVSKEGAKAIHPNGDYTLMYGGGLKRYRANGDAKGEYHYLTQYAGFSGQDTVWVQLRDDFKGKRFTAYSVISDTWEGSWDQTDPWVVKRFVTFVQTDQIDYENARVPILIYRIDKNYKTGESRKMPCAGILLVIA